MEDDVDLPDGLEGERPRTPCSTALSDVGVQPVDGGRSQLLQHDTTDARKDVPLDETPVALEGGPRDAHGHGVEPLVRQELGDGDPGAIDVSPLLPLHEDLGQRCLRFLPRGEATTRPTRPAATFSAEVDDVVPRVFPGATVRAAAVAFPVPASTWAP